MENINRLHPEDVKIITQHVVQELQELMKNKNDKKWITSKEVKDLLGVSNSKLHQMRNNNLITFSYFGRNIYYDIDEIHQLLEQNAVQRLIT